MINRYSSNSNRPLMFAVYFVAALALSACGGEDGGEGSRLNMTVPFSERESTSGSTNGSGSNGSNDVQGTSSAAEGPSTSRDESSTAGDSSTVEEDTATVEDDTFTVSDDTAVIEEDTSTDEGDTYIVEEDTPTVEDDIAVIEEDTATVEEDTSTVEEDTATVEEDTSTVEEDTSIVDGDSSIPDDDDRATEVSSTVVLRWSVPTERKNGDFLPPEELGGYEIRYREISESDFRTIVITEALQDRHDFDEELSGKYEFQIAAYDSNGLYSEFISLTPFEES